MSTTLPERTMSEEEQTTEPTRKKTGGRKKGSINNKTLDMRLAFQRVIRKRGGPTKFLDWLLTNHPKEFCSMFAKAFVPTEINLAATLQAEIKTEDISDLEAARRIAFILQKGAMLVQAGEEPQKLLPAPPKQEPKDVTPFTQEALDAIDLVERNAAARQEAVSQASSTCQTRRRRRALASSSTRARKWGGGSTEGCAQAHDRDRREQEPQSGGLWYCFHDYIVKVWVVADRRRNNWILKLHHCDR